MSEFGLYFTKEEHIQLIQIYLEILFSPESDFPMVEHFSNILTQLLKSVT